MECLITGCKVLDEFTNRAASCDLYGVGNCYVIRANVNRDGYVDWCYDPGVIPYTKQITLVAGLNSYFEKDGVIVIEKVFAELNNEACCYIYEGHK